MNEDRGSKNGWNIKVEGRELAGLEGNVGDSLFRAGTVMSNDPQSRRWTWTAEAM